MINVKHFYIYEKGATQWSVLAGSVRVKFSLFLQIKLWPGHSRKSQGYTITDRKTTSPVGKFKIWRVTTKYGSVKGWYLLQKESSWSWQIWVSLLGRTLRMRVPPKGCGWKAFHISPSLQQEGRCLLLCNCEYFIVWTLDSLTAIKVSVSCHSTCTWSWFVGVFFSSVRCWIW